MASRLPASADANGVLAPPLLFNRAVRGTRTHASPPMRQTPAAHRAFLSFRLADLAKVTLNASGTVQQLLTRVVTMAPPETPPGPRPSALRDTPQQRPGPGSVPLRLRLQHELMHAPSMRVTGMSIQGKRMVQNRPGVRLASTTANKRRMKQL